MAALRLLDDDLVLDVNTCPAARVNCLCPALALVLNFSNRASTLTSPSHLARHLSPSYRTLLNAPTLPSRFALPAYLGAWPAQAKSQSISIQLARVITSARIQQLGFIYASNPSELTRVHHHQLLSHSPKYHRLTLQRLN